MAAGAVVGRWGAALVPVDVDTGCGDVAFVFFGEGAACAAGGAVAAGEDRGGGAEGEEGGGQEQWRECEFHGERWLNGYLGLSCVVFFWEGDESL